MFASYMDELVSILAVDGHPSDNWFCGATSGGQLLIWDRRQRQVYKVNIVSNHRYSGGD
jgi:hypothetical protein